MNRRDLAKGPISWMARNPVAANLLMVSLVIGGLLISTKMKKEVFPVLELDQVNITMSYPGASPEEIERGILLVIEENVRSLDGVKEVRSTATEGAGNVAVVLETGVNKNKALTDIKNAVDRIATFPEEAEKPQVSLPELRREAINLAIYGDLDDKSLRELGETVRDELLQQDGVNIVELGGVRSLEIGVEIPQNTLRRYGLTLKDVSAQIRQTALESPGGGIKTRDGEVLLRTLERREYGAEFRDIPIIYGSGKGQVALRDIAAITDGFEETDNQAFFNGLPTVIVKIYSVGSQSPTEVAKVVKDYAADLSQRLPDGVGAVTLNDMTKYFQGRLDLLLRNAAIGLALVLLILGLFLEPKLAVWVSMGIPISFIGSFVFLPALGISLNMISMFAFLVTLGMVVDDAIVIGENIHYLRKSGKPSLEAAIEGAKEMAVPVFFSVGTTIAAFSPLLFIPGVMGKISLAIPVIVILVLLISLVESFFILPAHLAHSKEVKRNGFLGPILRFQERFSLAFEDFAQTRFRRLANLAVTKRWVTLALSLAIFLVTVGLISGGRVKFMDMSNDDKDQVVAQAALPFGVSVKDTKEIMDRLIESGRRTVEKFGGEKISLGILSTLASGKGGGGPRGGAGETGSHLTSVTLLLVSGDQRSFSSTQFARAWREELGPIPSLESLQFQSTMHGMSKPIDFEISHGDIAILEESAREIGEYLGAFDGVTDVDNGIEFGKRQFNFKMTPEGVEAGVLAGTLAEQLRSAYYGSEALRQQRGRNEMRVMVRLPKEEREDLGSLGAMMIRTPSGGEIPLNRAASVESGRAYTTISRTDGRRVLRIKADVIEGKANAKEIMNKIFSDFLPELKSRHPGLYGSLSGRQAEFQDFFDFLFIGSLMALIVIYGMVAIPLNSYLQPVLVVMAAIPFGFVGAVLGHYFLGMNLDMFSMMGILALSGVVVNDSIVFVTTANELRVRGESPASAAVNAAVRRLRPIFLTSITTFAGLAPMIFETSFEAKMIIPMAVSLGFGIIFSTVFVLLLVPALFTLVENLRIFLKRREMPRPLSDRPGETA